MATRSRRGPSAGNTARQFCFNRRTTSRPRFSDVGTATRNASTSSFRLRCSNGSHTLYHVVFTLPHELAPLALQNKEVMYGLLFRCSAETLIEVASDPQHLGAEIGFFSVLHTWNQKLQHHPHVHCVVAAGGLSSDHTRWVRPRRSNFFVPEAVLSKV